MNNSEYGIQLTNLRKSFGGAAAVDGVSLDVPAGSFLVLLGPSGCGKTTMLRMLAGLESLSGGEIAFGDHVIASAGGTSVPAGKREAGLVFQSYALWPHMTVQSNIEWPLKVAKQAPDRRKTRVKEVLELLGIGQLADRYPGEISGGQQQRVAIARMIAPEPSVLLFDEPLSNLDAKLRVETRGELVRIHRATGATSVYVTHDQVEAMTMATHVALMRDGVVEQFGTPEELLTNPASAFVATFIGTPPANILTATVVSGIARTPSGQIITAAPRLDDGTVELMYRAEELSLAAGSGEGILRGEFLETTPIAGRYLVMGTIEGKRISVIADTNPRSAVGDTMWVRLPPEPEAFFDTSTGERISVSCDSESLA